MIGVQRMINNRFRLVTRSDFDGLVCAVLLKHIDLIDDIKFVHPKDMQDGKVNIDSQDITTNLPFVTSAHLAFDHHLSETLRISGEHKNHIIDSNAPSAARVVWDYYGGYETFPKEWEELMIAVDKADSAQYNQQEVLEPKSWELLNFLMDARTGLGRFRNFRISNYNLMMNLIDHCRTMSISQILTLPDVKERVSLYFEHQDPFINQIKRCSTVYDDLVVLDLRNEETIYAGNRFMIYALFPQCNISIHILWGLKQQNTVFATGKSIFKRDSEVNVGELMLQHGGGGHQAAGTCQVNNDLASSTLETLITHITQR